MIKGLTDKPIIRRDGKIRAGIRDKSDNPVNTDYFALHDAEQLIPILGEKPTEVYFTVYFDDLNAIAPNDLRWYKKSELVCMGNGETAAYFLNGDGPAGLKQEPAKLRYANPNGSEGFTTIPRSRERICNYRDCPDYIGNRCSEHIVLKMVIPQYSMSAWFDLENTSITAVLNVTGALNKAMLGKGRISGEIFRVFKDLANLPYENAKTGQRSRSEKNVVNMQHVPFEEYERLFKDKVPPTEWARLMDLRGSRGVMPNSVMLAAITADDVPRLDGPSGQSQPALPGPAADARPAAEIAEEKVRARANDPAVAEVFATICQMTGKENTEALRMQTARAFTDVQRLSDYLTKKIKEGKKEVAKAADAQAPVDPTPPAGAKEAQVLPAEVAKMPPPTTQPAAANTQGSVW